MEYGCLLKKNTVNVGGRGIYLCPYFRSDKNADYKFIHL